MGLLKDIKEEWTWRGIKKSFREDWPSLLVVFFAGLLTPVVLKRMDRQESMLAFFLIDALLILLVSAAIGVGKRFKRRIQA